MRLIYGRKDISEYHCHSLCSGLGICDSGQAGDYVPVSYIDGDFWTEQKSNEVISDLIYGKKLDMIQVIDDNGSLKLHDGIHRLYEIEQLFGNIEIPIIVLDKSYKIQAEEQE